MQMRIYYTGSIKIFVNGTLQRQVDAAVVYKRTFLTLNSSSHVQVGLKFRRQGLHDPGHDPAEFFAVATETFFEKPCQMAERHPALYQQFQGYYGVDPRDWLTASERLAAASEIVCMGN